MLLIVDAVSVSVSVSTTAVDVEFVKVIEEVVGSMVVESSAWGYHVSKLAGNT